LDCDGAIDKGTFNNDGLVKSGEASLLSKLELLKSRNSSFTLFGIPYDADSASASDLERLFFLAR